MSDGASAAKRLGHRRLFQRSLVALAAVLVAIGVGWIIVSPSVEDRAKFDAVKADFAQTWCATYGEDPTDIASASGPWLSFVERNRDFLEENFDQLGATSTSLEGTVKKNNMIELTVEDFLAVERELNELADELASDFPDEDISVEELTGGSFPPESFWFGYAFPRHFQFFDFGGGGDNPPQC